MDTELFGIGISEKTLTDLERRIFREASPYAVVLFGRNVESIEQLGELVREVKSISKRPPLFMIDEEGGRVDRLRQLLPGLPSAERLGEGERGAELSRWVGEIIGRAVRFFDIEVNLAPVVDIRADQAPKGLEQRTFGRDAERVISLAGEFMRGLHGAGVASCLKHFPGIGLGSADPHYGATVIDVSLDDLMNRDLLPFMRLGDEARAIMISHGTYPQIDDPDLPATLSRRLTTDLLRSRVGFDGIAISDDMEMHAVADLGSYEMIAERALLAGNDVILFCSHIERVPDLQKYLRTRVNERTAIRARFEEAGERCEAYRAHCERLRSVAPPAVGSFGQIAGQLTQFLEVFEQARLRGAEGQRTSSDTKGRGPTGGEEWT